ncbi:MAG: glycosyltransferase family 2 protein [Nanoarchaeota archaeon]
MINKVSFVILSHNDAEMAVNAVESIKRLRTKYKYDIFVVDNGSEDGAPKIIKSKFEDVRVIELSKNVGTAAYDFAIRKSQSEYIFFTGCDIEARDNMLDKLVEFMDKNKDVALAAPKYLNFDNRKKIDCAGTWLSRSFYSGTFKDNNLGKKNIEIPYIGAGLIRKTIIEKFGYLNDKDYFFYGEDVDLGLRIRLLGFKVYYIPGSIVYHMGSISRRIRKPFSLTFLMERNLLTTFFKILEKKSILLLFPYVFFMRLVAIVKDLTRFDFMNSFARIYAILWVIFNLNFISKKREKIQKMRKVNDNVLFKLFSERYLFKT